MHGDTGYVDPYDEGDDDDEDSDVEGDREGDVPGPGNDGVEGGSNAPVDDDSEPFEGYDGASGARSAGGPIGMEG